MPGGMGVFHTLSHLTSQSQTASSIITILQIGKQNFRKMNGTYQNFTYTVRGKHGFESRPSDSKAYSLSTTLFSSHFLSLHKNKISRNHFLKSTQEKIRQRSTKGQH